MIERKSSIPNQSVLKSEERFYNYVDSYHGWFITEGNTTSLKEFVKLFIYSGPKWADFLMTIRDNIVGLFGLMTSNQLTEQEKHPDNIKLELGEQLGIFKLLDKNENEIIVGEDDKHLNFKVSLLLEPLTEVTAKMELIITTCVKFNNLFGKVYFIPVKPFHKIIVYRTLKNIIRQLENKPLKN
jgi:hypothetical protein